MEPWTLILEQETRLCFLSVLCSWVHCCIYVICFDFFIVLLLWCQLSAMYIVVFLCKLFLFPNFMIHRSIMRGTMPQLTFQHCPFKNENMRGSQGFKVLHSWMYPQSVLPSSLISVLSSSTAEGGCQAAFNLPRF